MTRAPGPKGGLILGSLPAFKADPLAFLAQGLRDHGPVFRFRMGPFTAHLVNAPDHIDHVLSRNARGYDKATRSADRIAATTGNSLLSPDPEHWTRHRQVIQPAFQPRRFDGTIAPAIDALLLPAMQDWLRSGRVDIVAEMMRIVIGAAIRILFSAEIEARRISDPLEVLLADTWRRIEAPFDLSQLSRHLHRRTFRRAVGQIDAIVLGLIAARRAMAAPPDDVLTRLVAARSAETGAGLTDRELRDATVTLLLAGHETTANALARAFIHAAGGHETAPPAQIFAEAMRLYPSIWVIERRARVADRIGDFDIPAGSSVLISPWLLHRDPRLWPDPERFDPSRFSADTPPPRRAYMPFGLGQHRCVGLHLAQGIAEHILATVFDRLRLRLLPGQDLRPRPGITLRHAVPVMMEVTRRG
ncbi:cytochrome P450 [Szabonella alba]|uniref:Cytochrome P450 n=1 Tax=Szabonella alba TaxID=2804194 RepID=A0A8K0Y1Z6_9RHOB|nr:cytochrome P450 [Szabonella alba]MBL4918482.1 cytochrome P450 [Szabonella alba]